MVIFYNIDNKKICMVAYDCMFPTLPANMTEEEVTKYYKEKEKMEFVSIPDSKKPEGDIFNYNLSFNNNGDFLGLVRKVN